MFNFKKFPNFLLILALSALAIIASVRWAGAGTAHYDTERSVIIMEGNTDRKLRFMTLDLLKKHKKDVEYIEMSGPGGLMTDMVVIMGAIKKSGLPVRVPTGSFCASACAFAAVSSENVIVDGTLLFHMGYIAGYHSGASLHDILNHGQAMVADIAPVFAEIGFKAYFLELLIKNTGPGQWYVVTKASQLADCRMEGNNNLEDYFSLCYFSAPSMSTKEAMLLGSRSDKSHLTTETKTTQR